MLFCWLGGEFDRRAGPVVEHQMHQFGPGIMADTVHHPLALEDEAHVEIGDQDALALGEWWRNMPALG